MTRVLLYEFIASGWLLAMPELAASESLRREGLAMLTALAADFAALDDVETTVLVDSRWRDPPLPGCRIVPIRTHDEDLSLLRTRASAADWTVLIAPEFNKLLQSRCELVESASGRLLGPSANLVALTADKQRTAEHLAAAGVAVPQGVALGPSEPLPLDFPFPAVLKPRFGAGSQDVRLIPDRTAAERLSRALAEPARLERFCPGMAASVAFVCGPAGRFALAPCEQRLTADGRFQYLGGRCPLEPALSRRAKVLAERAVASLPNPLGYLGVDLVLGDDPAGGDDFVIEINPRLTTSYIGLRRIVRQNLARLMMDVAAGRSPCVSFNQSGVEFDADGSVRAFDAG